MQNNKEKPNDFNFTDGKKNIGNLKSDSKGHAKNLKSDSKGHGENLKSNSKGNKAMLKSDNDEKLKDFNFTDGKKNIGNLKSDSKGHVENLKSDSKGHVENLKSNSKGHVENLKSNSKGNKPMLKSNNKKKNHTTKVLVGITFMATSLLLILSGTFFMFDFSQSDKVQKGTYINGYNISGMDKKQATNYLSQIYASKTNDFNLKINYSDKSWEFKKEDFAINTNLHTILDSAYERNNELNQFIKNKNLILKDGSASVSIEYLLPELTNKIDAILKEIEIPAINSTIKFEPLNDKKFTITKEATGKRVNREKLINDINNQFINSNNISINIEMVDEIPTISYDYNMSLTTPICDFSTNVSDSTGNRKKNVSRALSDFNGMVINPNEQVSFNNVTCPHSANNGYKIAKIIYNNKFVDGVGGGICQASTTLYNALIRSGIQIDEVHKHSLIVKYVPLALDSMVSSSSDLKFTNISNYPIFIETYATKDNVGVKIFSHALDYIYEPVSKTISTIEPPPDIIKLDIDKEYQDKVLFKGEKYRINHGKEGYVVKAYLNIYKGDSLIESKEIRSEVYQPLQGMVIEGCETLTTGINPIID